MCEAANQRVNCGWPGISRNQCESRKCCWDSSLSNTVWCSFYGSGK